MCWYETAWCSGITTAASATASLQPLGGPTPSHALEVRVQQRRPVRLVLLPLQREQVDERMGDAGVRPVEVDELAVQPSDVGEVQVAVHERRGKPERGEPAAGPLQLRRQPPSSPTSSGVEPRDRLGVVRRAGRSAPPARPAAGRGSRRRAARPPARRSGAAGRRTARSISSRISSGASQPNSSSNAVRATATPRPARRPAAPGRDRGTVRPAGRSPSPRRRRAAAAPAP